MKLYYIIDYDKRYRPKTTKGEDLVTAKYVKLPVKPRGKGLQALLKRKNGIKILGVWSLLLQAATENAPEFRGKLLNHKDNPATITEIAEAISLENKEVMVKEALETLEDMGWVSSVENTEKLRSESVAGTHKVKHKLKLKLSGIKAKAISSFTDLAEHHILVCPAPKATKEFFEQILGKFDDIEAVHGLKFTKALAYEFSHRSTRGDGMGLLFTAVKRGWMKDKLREEAFVKNITEDKTAKAELDKLPVSQQAKELAKKHKVVTEPTTEEKKQALRKQAAAMKGD